MRRSSRFRQIHYIPRVFWQQIDKMMQIGYYYCRKKPTFMKTIPYICFFASFTVLIAIACYAYRVFQESRKLKRELEKEKAVRTWTASFLFWLLRRNPRCVRSGSGFFHENVPVAFFAVGKPFVCFKASAFACRVVRRVHRKLRR